MTIPDLINGMFEACGSVCLWLNVRRIAQDKGYAGVYLPTTIFFSAWGFWNLYYYPHLGQWLSFAGGVSIVTANVAWAALMLKYGRKR